MIFMRERCTEQRHDPVAHYLIDRALVAMDGFHHVFEHWVEKPARLLGIAISQQFHRPLHVGEQYSDLLPLTLEGFPRREDLVGEVLGRVTLGRRKARIVRNGRQGTATLVAELRCGRPLTSTVGTGSRQWSTTLRAELRLNSVLVLAVWTFHCRPWRKNASRIFYKRNVER